MVHFIDRALITFDKENQPAYRQGLTEMNAKRTQMFPGSASCAALTSDQRIALLKSIEFTPFFRLLRTHTMFGFLADPLYGGNPAGGYQTWASGRPTSISRRSAGTTTRPTEVKTKMPAPYKTTDTVDFVVIGSGAAGGSVAKELAEAGFDVVVLEQGPYLKEKDFTHDEVKFAYQGSPLMNDFRKQPQTFRQTPSETARQRPAVGYGRQVGGGTVHFNANYWRFLELDFRERSLWGEIPGTGFADWPITYADLEPYYTKAEYDIGVSG